MRFRALVRTHAAHAELPRPEVDAVLRRVALADLDISGRTPTVRMRNAWMQPHRQFPSVSPLSCVPAQFGAEKMAPRNSRPQLDPSAQE